ncbi:MAG: cell division protein FtsH, partial [Lachnospiraceae bacterium]|nr:cell division protein FtsH [Lachnospiraceae bacterium]
MKKQNQSFVFLVIVLLLAAAIWVSFSTRQTSNYTKEAFEEAVANGDVVSITIAQNKEVPTGTIQVSLGNGAVRQFHATDVREVESFAKEHN